MSQDPKQNPENEWADPYEDDIQGDSGQEPAGDSDANDQVSDAPDANETPADEQAQPDTDGEQTADDVPAGDADPAPSAGEQDAAQPQWSQSLLEAAGLPNAEVAKQQFGTPKALENAVRLMDARAVQIGQHFSQVPPTAPQQPPHPQWQQQGPPIQQPQQPTNEPAAGDDEFKMPDPPEGEEWDEATTSLVKSLHSQFNSKWKQQQELLSQQQQFINSHLQQQQQAQLQQYVQEFDGFVNALPETWAPVLGKGSGFEMAAKNPQSPQLQARVHLDNVAKQLQAGRQAQNLPPLSRNDLLDRALRVAFPQQHEENIRSEVETEVSKRQRMVTNRPTVRGSRSNLSPEEAAAQKADRWFQDRGLSGPPAESFQYDEV
jgi:hypothetical protein